MPSSTYSSRLQKQPQAGISIHDDIKTCTEHNGDRSWSVLIPPCHVSCSHTADEDGKRRLRRWSHIDVVSRGGRCEDVCRALTEKHMSPLPDDARRARQVFACQRN